MPQTPNKGYEVQVTGSNSGTWGSTLNSDVITIVDNNLGSTTTKSLTNVNVTLSATESQSLILRLTGTLTGAVQITTAAVGMTIVENATSGNFAVTFTDGVGAVTLPQSARSLVITGASQGARIVANNFPSGTAMLFAQASAPAGWTKSVAQNNAGIRLVSGSGGGTGGSIDFTTAFVNQTPTGTVGSTTLTTSQIPSHSHFCFTNVFLNNNTFTVDASHSAAVQLSFGNNLGYVMCSDNSSTQATLGPTSSSGSSASHTHTLTMDALNLGIKIHRCD
ncbi:MAG TPA: hypothetical protein VI358_17960, partial [Pseudolabrys sp.]